MKIDEAAFALATWNYNDHAREIARRFLDKYLAALPPEPEIEGVRVRVCVAVGRNGVACAAGCSLWSDDEARGEAALAHNDKPYQFRWIEATVPPYAPPAEPVVEGRVVE